MPYEFMMCLYKHIYADGEFHGCHPFFSCVLETKKVFFPFIQDSLLWAAIKEKEAHGIPVVVPVFEKEPNKKINSDTWKVTDGFVIHLVQNKKVIFQKDYSISALNRFVARLQIEIEKSCTHSNGHSSYALFSRSKNKSCQHQEPDGNEKSGITLIEDETQWAQNPYIQKYPIVDPSDFKLAEELTKNKTNRVVLIEREGAYQRMQEFVEKNSESGLESAAFLTGYPGQWNGRLASVINGFKEFPHSEEIQSSQSSIHVPPKSFAGIKNCMGVLHTHPVGIEDLRERKNMLFFSEPQDYKMLHLFYKPFQIALVAANKLPLQFAVYGWQDGEIQPIERDVYLVSNKEI